MYYRLLARGMQLYPDLPHRGSKVAYNLDLWIGTRWHWKREQIEFGPRIEAREHLMPTAFIADNKTSSTSSTVSAKTAKAEGNDGDYLLELQALAIQHDTHAEFLSTVLKNKDLAAQVKSAGLLPNIMDKSEKGFWATARQ
jgi:hypothetical protein